MVASQVLPTSIAPRFVVKINFPFIFNTIFEKRQKILLAISGSAIYRHSLVETSDQMQFHSRVLSEKSCNTQVKKVANNRAFSHVGFFHNRLLR